MFSQHVVAALWLLALSYASELLFLLEGWRELLLSILLSVKVVRSLGFIDGFETFIALGNGGMPPRYPQRFYSLPGRRI